ncbi:MAG: hypothetical protein ACRBBN_18265 [Methyloligellaceae bacterium]
MTNDVHNRFMREQHEKRLVQDEIAANAASAELIAERISAKLAEQNDIIYKIGQQNGRTTVIAYISLIIGAIAAVGQLFGPLNLW